MQFGRYSVAFGLGSKQTPNWQIAYTGPLYENNMNYILHLNSWLHQKSQVKVSIHPHLGMQDLDLLAPAFFSARSWGKPECEAAIRLAAGDDSQTFDALELLPLPYATSTSKFK